MRLMFFDDYRLGVVQGDHLHDVTAALGDLSGVGPQERLVMLVSGFGEIRRRIDQALEQGAVRPLKGLRMRASVPRPMKLICAARNYRELGTVGGDVPIEFFLKSSEAILDPGGVVELPPHDATIFHHEAELAVVIGRTARRVAASDALDYVFGYTPFVDVSARGLMPRSFFSGKSFDTFAPIGPVIVTADEVPDPQRLRLELDVSGDPRQRFGTDDMANTVAELIENASAVTTLRPGDVIATGTNHQQLGPLQDGDRVSLRVEDWPALEFTIRDERKRSWPRVLDQAMAATARAPR